MAFRPLVLASILVLGAAPAFSEDAAAPAQKPERLHQGFLGVQQVMKDGKIQVTGTVPGGPAAAAGLLQGDLILAVDGNPMAALEAMVAAIQAAPGKPVTLRISRGGKELDLQATPGSRYADAPGVQKAYAALNEEVKPLAMAARKSGDWSGVEARFAAFTKAHPGTDAAAQAAVTVLSVSKLPPDEFLKGAEAWVSALPPEPNLDGQEFSHMYGFRRKAGGPDEGWITLLTGLAASAKEPRVRAAAHLELAQFKNPSEAEVLKHVKAILAEVPGTPLAKQAEALSYDIEILGVGKPAPDFKLPTLDGKELSLSALKGKPVLIDFWASWCGPCRAEMPHVRAAHEAYAAKGLQVVGICMDQSPAKGTAFAEENRLAWVHGCDGLVWEGPVQKAYSIHSIPAVFLIDAEGRIVAKGLRGEEIGKAVAKLLP